VVSVLAVEIQCVEPSHTVSAVHTRLDVPVLAVLSY
jgi:hypothetical protein